MSPNARPLVSITNPAQNGLMNLHMQPNLVAELVRIKGGD